MFRKFRSQVLSLAALMVVPFMLRATSIGYAGAPEPPDPSSERLSGPAIVGTVVLSEETGFVTFTGNCRGSAMSLVRTLGDFGLAKVDGITADSLEGIRPFNTAEAGGCYVIGGTLLPGDLVVNTVTRFRNDGTTVSADIVVLAVVPF